MFLLDRPFFDVDVELSVPTIALSPSLDDVQVRCRAKREQLKDFYLKAKAKIWPWLSYMCRVRSTTDRSFFDVDLEPSVPTIALSPSLDDVQVPEASFSVVKQEYSCSTGPSPMWTSRSRRAGRGLRPDHRSLPFIG